jgi:NAD(P)-dependent dehydrogenase (short-subunit alcohol dehydrogenase family)
MNRLEGRIAFVTGTAQGIGRAIALAMAAEGASVSCVDINATGNEATTDRIRSAGSKALTFNADVAEEELMHAAVDETVAHFGRLDILVNNAATFDPGLYDTDTNAETTPVATWDRTMDVNLRGPFLTCKYSLPHMRREGGGVILNISSNAAFYGDVVHVAYGSSKAALQQLARSIATTHGRAGVRCNTIATGLIMAEAAHTNSSEKLATWGRHRLVKDVGTPEQVAAMAVHLCSDDSSYVTGQTIIMDGGTSSVHQPWYVDAPVLYPHVEVFGRTD